MFAYSLEELEMESLGMLMLILLETLIEEDLSQVMSLQSEVVQSVGKPLCKLQWLCLPLKLSTWRLLRLVKKLYGWRDSLVNSMKTFKSVQYFVTVKVQSFLQKIKCFMKEQTILMFGIILFVILLLVVILLWAKLVLMKILQIWWLSHFL